MFHIIFECNQSQDESFVMAEGSAILRAIYTQKLHAPGGLEIQVGLRVQLLVLYTERSQFRLNPEPAGGLGAAKDPTGGTRRSWSGRLCPRYY